MMQKFEVLRRIKEW